MEPSPQDLLFDALEAYQVSGVAGLRSILAATEPSEDWIDALVAASGQSNSSVVATWLVRAHLEGGAVLGPRAAAAWIRAGERMTENDARLHFCQSIARIEVPSRSAEPLARSLRAALDAEHKFTRAWAVDAFQRLAAQHPRYGPEALAALDAGLRDPAASVRARARNVAKECRLGPR